ncbi:MAG: tyrosine--tRNA ligase [Streptosporangiaceae bacterium]
MSNAAASGEQAGMLMEGCEFGDPQLEASMRDRLRARLAVAAGERRPLRVCTGYDPAAPDLHLAHSITLRAMKRFQRLGHHVIVVVGTMTAMAGDTSDRAARRPRTSEDEVAAAARSYAGQASTILDPARTEVVANGDWLAGLAVPQILELASTFAVQQFLARDNYRRRVERGDPVGLHEFLCALLQGYDAVHLRADVQLGATGQLFNIMAGARLQEASGQPPCVALTFPVLAGTDGTDRMSKSRGNYIGLTDSPAGQFGKIMSIPDHVMPQWVRLVTDWPAGPGEEFIAALASGALHPMEAKKQPGHRIVGLYHGSRAADAAQRAFERTHQLGGQPDVIPEVTLHDPMHLADLLVSIGAASSKSDARRLIAGRGVSLNGQKAPSGELVIDATVTIKVGPRRFNRIVFN